MIFKLGPKTISIPSARLPQIGLPYLKLLTAIRIPLPKMLKFGGGRAALMSILVVAGGFGASFALVINGTSDVPTWPEAGAVYALPNLNGQRLAPDESDPATRSQTLQINLADGVRLDKLELKNLDLGKAGLSNSFEISRTSGVTGAQVHVGIITIRNSSAPTLDWANIETGCITLAGNVDGHTNAVQIDATIPTLVIDSDRGSGSYIAQDSTVDRIIINTNGDNGAIIGEIIIDDVDASVGAWDWDYIKAGCIVLENTNTFGNGTGINTASAVFNSSVKARVITDNLVDTPVSVK
jgi:hypothetical protein